MLEFLAYGEEDGMTVERLSVDEFGETVVISVRQPLARLRLPGSVYFNVRVAANDEWGTSEMVRYMTLADARQVLRERGELT